MIVVVGALKVTAVPTSAMHQGALVYGTMSVELADTFNVAVVEVPAAVQVSTQKTTHQGGAQVARDAEAAERLRLIKGELGINRKVKPHCPTLKDFKDTFINWVRAEINGERTRDFYETCYDRLLEFREFGKSKLDEIDEPTIERFKLSLRKASKTTANRYLATLRQALRYACRKLKLIDNTPVIELYKHDKDNTVERECEYVHSTAENQAWLAASREPLRSASILAHDGGIGRGE